MLSVAHTESNAKRCIWSVAKYSTSELEVLAQMLAKVVDEMEQNPDQDMLGELFMALGLANEWKGQFFTPYDICRAMAAMNLGEDLKSQIEEKAGYL